MSEPQKASASTPKGASANSPLTRLLDEQSLRWQQGERPAIEAYLRAHPDLAAHPDAVLDLIYNEVVQRSRCGEHPRLDEYLPRFPHLAEPLRAQFEVHGAVESDFLFRDRSTAPSAGGMATPGVPSLPGYQILGELGRGGMGVVYKAHDPRLNRLVAIKVLAPVLASHAQARQRFLLEGQAAAAVRHDNVVPIHAALEVAGQPVLVLEYVPGGSLQKRLVADQPLPLPDVLRIGAEVAAGLAAAHARGVIHRDVKPGNILLDAESGRARLTDFGLARIGRAAGLTEPGLVMGTPSYMAPEQARGDAVDARADLYSLGCVLYHMATGHAPLCAASTLKELAAESQANPRPVRQVNPQVPAWLARIIDRLLARNAADRFATAAEVEALLRRGQAPPHPVAAALRSSPRQRRWRLLGIGCAAVVIATVIAVVAILAGRDQPPEPAPSQPSGNGASPVSPARPREGVLVVIPPSDFYYPDYITVCSRLDRGGVRVKVTSTVALAHVQPGPSGQDVKPDLDLAQARGDAYDAVVFCGGWGVFEYIGEGSAAKQAQRVIAEAVSAKPPIYVTAIGTAPIILAHAGCLRGLKATCVPYGKPPEKIPGTYIRELEAHGATWVDEDVVESGFFITGKGPSSTTKFVSVLLERLKPPR